MINVGKNAKLQFHWKVSPYDYSEEKMNEIIAKASKKYSIKKDQIKVIPDFIMLNEKGEDISVTNDTILNIQRPEFQLHLFKEYLNLNSITDYDFDFIKKIDGDINGLIDYELFDKHRKYSIKWIKWSNFLSYGSDNYFDFTTLNGLVLLNGEPSNQSGKTTFAIDLLHFLLYGKTDKASTQEKIFNKFLKEETEMTVEGCITIDGEDYIIKRTLTRPQLGKRTSKSKTTQKVEYYKIVNGEYEELETYVDEQQAENSIQTNKIIADAIGNENDFDLIICATSSNLDDLIEKKDTERGRILSRWMGLTPIEEKEKKAKEVFNTQIKPYLFSNQYNIETLLRERDAFIKVNEDLTKQIEKFSYDNEVLDKNILLIEENKKVLLSTKRLIDENIKKIDKTTLEKTIQTLTEKGIAKKTEIANITEEINKIGDVNFSIEEYDSLNARNLEINKQIAAIDTHISYTSKQIVQLEKSEYCPTCGKKFDNVDNTAKINELKAFINTSQETRNNLETEGKAIVKRLEEISTNRELYEKKSRLTIKKSASDVEILNLRNQLIEQRNLKKEFDLNAEAIEKNNEIDIKVRNYEVQLVGYRNTKESNIRYVENLTAQVNNNAGQIKTIEEMVEKIKEEQNVVKHWKIYLDLVGKNGIIKMVLRKSIPILNAQLAHLLTDVCDFKVQIEINEKNEILFFLIKDGVKSDISSGSGFEKTASALALRFVLAKNSVLPRLNYIVLDEVFGRVAQDNYDNIKTILDRVQDEYTAIMIVSHLEQIKEWCCKYVTVTKNLQGVSSLKVENR